MTTIYSSIEPRKHVRVTPIGDQDVVLDVGRPGCPAVSLAAIRIPVAELRAALDADAPAGPHTRTDEADWKARAEKREKERNTALVAVHVTHQQRDDERARAKKAEQERDEARAERDSWRAQVPLAEWEKELIQATDEHHPLTADDISEAEWDQIAERAWEYWECHMILNPHGLKRMMQAALTEPTRPKGAEDWEDWLIHNLDHESLTDQQIEDLANRVAQRVTEEQS